MVSISSTFLHSFFITSSQVSGNLDNNYSDLEIINKFTEVPMSCPYFKEGYFGICVAPEAIHVPAIAEMESFCFKEHYGECPSFSVDEKSEDTESAPRVSMKSKSPYGEKADLHFAW